MERVKEGYDLAEDMRSVPLLEKETVEFISSGCTNLNLVLSGKGKGGGWARGRIVNIVGDKSTGKTLLALEAAAWFYHNIKKIISKLYPKVKKLIIVFNNVEMVMDFRVAFMFGEKFFKDVEWVRTPYVEDFGRDYLHRVKSLKKGESLLYILDSYDALDSKKEGEAFDESIDKDKEMDGSFNLGKQQYGSKRFFKKCCNEMENKDATLIIVSQTRQRIGITFGKQKYRAGGDALDFYTHQVVWLYEKGRIEKQALSKKKVIGIKVKARVEKNKTAPPWEETNPYITILFDYGIDDVRSMIDWYFGPDKKLLKWGIDEYKRDDLIKALEGDSEILDLLVDSVEEKWNKIIEMTRLKDKRKYDQD